MAGWAYGVGPLKIKNLRTLAQEHTLQRQNLKPFCRGSAAAGFCPTSHRLQREDAPSRLPTGMSASWCCSVSGVPFRGSESDLVLSSQSM